jgi:5-bromo-4-chloroindolyl phosphate hydrolysis protein
MHVFIDWSYLVVVLASVSFKQSVVSIRETMNEVLPLTHEYRPCKSKLEVGHARITSLAKQIIYA